MILILSGSLHPTSRSRVLAKHCRQILSDHSIANDYFDLAETPLPPCDGAAAYGDPAVVDLAQRIGESAGVIIASPVYNYDVNAAVKNAVELTGRAWTDKVVGLMLAAGGAGSYMSAMGLASSLMLDFRCLIIPRFVYATGEHFEGDAVADDEIDRRVKRLCEDMRKLSSAMTPRD